MLRCIRQSVRSAGGRDNMLFRHEQATSVGPLQPYVARSTSRHTFIAPSCLTRSISSLQPPLASHHVREETVTNVPPVEVPSSEDHAIRSMARLRDMLSSQPDPRPLTVHRIRRRYHHWRSCHLLDKMTSLELSSLIRLLGTLSTSEYGHPQTLPYVHPHALHMQKSSFAPHWAFIQEIVHDKRTLGYPLLPSDHYWSMRAYLARFWERVKTDSLLAEQMLTKAGKHYFTLCTTTSHSDIHALYLDALSASPSSGPVHELMVSIISALHKQRHNPDTIVDTLLRLVLRCNNQLSDSNREELLRVVSTIVATSAKTSYGHPRGHSVVEAPETEMLVTALESTLFARGRASADERISSWSITLASKLFTLDSAMRCPFDVRWNCLILLALARTRSPDGTGHATAAIDDPIQHAAVVEWRTVCVLSAMETLFRSNEFHETQFGNNILQGFTRVVRRVWRDWTTVHPSVAPPRSLFVTRIICASFLRIGGQLKDKALVQVCRDFCVAAGLWSVRETHPGAESGLQLLASEQLYASLVCGTFFERALVDLAAYTNHMQILRGAVDTAVVRYSRADPEHAQELIAWAKSRAVFPTDTVVADVGVALAKWGTSGFLDRYLNDAQLAPKLRAKVVSAHLRMYMRYGRRFIDPTDVVERMENLFVLAAQLESPDTFLSRLRVVLLFLIRHQHASKVVKMVEDVSTQHPNWFSELFYTHLLCTLLNHRQFRLAQRTLSLCSSKHPNDAERWTSLVLSKLYRARARRLVTYLLRQPRTSRASLVALERSRTRIQEPMRVSLQSHWNMRTDDPHGWRQTVNSLVRKGHFIAAKQLFKAVHDRASPSTRTSIGNAILHGYLLKRTSNRRRLETVVDTYRQFKEEYGFAPDHVTVNILLKAQLRSQQGMDARMTRQLFDVIIRTGYPTGASTSNLGVDPPPFGMDAQLVETAIVGKLKIPRVGGPLLYKRHVQPLYKMFVKAFYQRGDVAAARKVLGIMKTLEAQEWSSRA